MFRVLLRLRFLLDLEQIFHTHPGGRSIWTTSDHWQSAFTNLHQGTDRRFCRLPWWHDAEPLSEDLGDKIFYRPPLHDSA